MSVKKYLDDTQTARLWAKIKALIPDVSGKLDKSGGTMTGKLTLDGDPTSNYHAATKKYVDENAGGGSVDSVNGQTGVVVLDASDVGAQASITASGMLKADGNGNVSAAVAGTDYIASHQDISGKLDKSGGTMTGALTLSGAPTTDLHASTKKYVDDEVADSIPQILYGKLDSTSTDTAMTAQISGLTELKHGTTIILKNGVVTSADGVTLDINSLGAKPIYSSMAATTSVKTVFNINYTMLFTYDTERLSTGCWIMYYGYNANTTYTNASLGQGYATCSTAESTAAKTASLSSYSLTAGGYVAVKFTYAVPANATLSVNSKTAKSIYYKNAAITAGIIKAGDLAVFLYNGSQYHLVAIDRNVESQPKITASGLLKGDGSGGVTAAVSGTDYQAPLTADTDYLTPNTQKVQLELFVSGSSATLLSGPEAPVTFSEFGEILCISQGVILYQYPPATEDATALFYEAVKWDVDTSTVILQCVGGNTIHTATLTDSGQGLTGTYAVTYTQPKVTASGILKGDGNGGVTAATAGTDYASASHSHGNITSGGDITATAPTIASGDQLVINDNSASKITNGPTFDGSTTTKALTPKGTWETFLTLATLPIYNGGVS